MGWLSSRYYLFYGVLLTALVSTFLYSTVDPRWGWLALASGFLAFLGIWDVIQQKRTVSRLYPVLARFRYLFESVGPEIRQYFIEADMEPVPFSRQQRSLVYQRAKNTLDKRPFGTLLDVYADGYEWMNHSIMPTQLETHDFRVQIGQGDTAYAASVFNISAMSYGALSPAAIRSMNRGARLGNFYHDTGEGSISSFHRENDGDLVWEIGSGYFGCRDEDGFFDPERFAQNARDPQVKMIELKLSQGAKPGQGGILPGPKVTPEIAAARGVPPWKDCISPARHSAFDSPIGLMQFIARLRELSGGKPTGFKLAIGHPWEFFAIAKAIKETGIVPDFVVVDGSEGGTGAAPVEFSDHVGMPRREALLLVHNTLTGLGLRGRIKLGAAGKLVSGFDLARTMSLGADWCNSARGFMFAVGCIQSQSCHTGKCPSGVATQDESRWIHLDVPDKAQRVFHFHQNTLKALKELVSAAGLNHPQELGPEHILRRVSRTQTAPLSQIYGFVEPGALLHSTPDFGAFAQYWQQSRADTFAPPEWVRALRDRK